jgi:basic membrane protein A
MGTKKIGAVGGFPIAAVDSYVAGYKFCANRAVPGTTTLVRYSYDFDTKSKCSTIAKNEIHQGAQVIFQVAGPCGDGALTAAAALGKWGIGVDTDESAVAPGHILTSAVKKTDVSVFKVIHGALTNDWQGGKDLVLSLKDNGVGVGTIAPQVPASWKSLLLSYKQKIVSGAIKPPDHCPGAHC